MNGELQNKPALDRIWAIAAILVALVLIYVLSIGPVGLICDKLGADLSAFRHFYYPLVWLHENTPLRKPLDMYVELWEGR